MKKEVMCKYPPPYNGKYGFSELNVCEEKIIQGDYRLIRIASNTYSKKYGKKVIALRDKEGVLIKRIS